jgi:hypothetical protein
MCEQMRRTSKRHQDTTWTDAARCLVLVRVLLPEGRLKLRV